MRTGFKYVCFIAFWALLIVFALQNPIAANIPVDTIKIPVVTIYDTHPENDLTLSDNRDTADITNLLYRDIGRILQSRSPMHIRSYGPGLIYSITNRGSNSAQIAVLWNDILINHPLPGMADLSLLKSGNTGSIRFNPLGSQSGIAGTLEIDDHFSLKNNMLAFGGGLHSTIGYDLGVHAVIAGQKHHLQSYFSADQNRNSFSFLKGNELAKQTHAASRFSQFKSSYKYTIGRHSHIGTHIWLTDSHREIPASLYEQFSDANQTDQAARVLIFYQYQLKKTVLKIHSAFVRDLLHYNSPNKSISTQSTGNKLVQQIHFSGQLSGKTQFYARLENEQVFAFSTVFPDKKSYNQTLLQAYIDTRFAKGFKLMGGFNSGFRKQHFVPFAPFLQTGLKINSNAEIMLSAGRNFRYPGINDYFWPTGGNPDLKPEIASEADLGFTLKKYKQFNAGTHIYIKQTRDWIIWLPKQGLFYAQNMENVRSFGIESNLGYNRNTQNLAFSTDLMYHFNRNYSLTNNPGLHQMIYSPVHTIKNLLKLGFRSNTITFFQAWTSKVYISTDNIYYLKPYYLLDISFDRAFRIGKSHSRWFISVNNLLNTRYQTIENYPMPGIHFLTGFKTEWFPDQNKHPKK